MTIEYKQYPVDTSANGIFQSQSEPLHLAAQTADQTT